MLNITNEKTTVDPRRDGFREFCQRSVFKFSVGYGLPGCHNKLELTLHYLLNGLDPETGMEVPRVPMPAKASKALMAQG